MCSQKLAYVLGVYERDRSIIRPVGRDQLGGFFIFFASP